jgi:IclR family transcriptional regulator, acetate operon repressor
MARQLGEPTLIASVQRALRLIEAISGHETGVSAKQLAREAALPLATTYHLLRTLVHEGYVRKLDDGGYLLGDGIDTVHARSRTQAVLNRARPALAALRDELSAAAYLSFFEDGEIRVVEIVDSPRAPRVSGWVGFRDAGHATALGKCVLRQLDDTTRRDYLARHPMVDLTPHTLTEPARLLTHLSSGLGQPMVMDKQEYELGVACAAVPVSDGKRVGSMGISVRAHQLPRLQKASRRLVETGQRLSRTLSFTY